MPFGRTRGTAPGLLFRVIVKSRNTSLVAFAANWRFPLQTEVPDLAPEPLACCGEPHTLQKAEFQLPALYFLISDDVRPLSL